MNRKLIPGIACMSLMLGGIASAAPIYRDYDTCDYGKNKTSCQQTEFKCDTTCDLSDQSSDCTLNADCSDAKCTVTCDDPCDKDLCDVPVCCPPTPPCQPPVDCCPKDPCDPNPTTAVPLPASSETAGASLIGIMLMGWIRSRRAAKA
jgi:hypothetical protein